MPKGIYDREPRGEETGEAEQVSRPNRADEVRTERRKRPGSTALPGIKLAVDESKLDRKTYSYRFANDTGSRIQQLVAEDWDPVDAPVKPDSNGIGTAQSAHAGNFEGKPFNAVLMHKRKDWFEADQKEKARPLDEMDKAIRRGAADTELRGPGVYTPGAGNTIE